MLTRRTFLSVAAATLAAPVARPNFIVILTGDQGWASTSFRMHPDIADSHCDYLETPNMARLAQQGMRFSSAYYPLRGAKQWLYEGGIRVRASSG